jgi:hypothetical protein
MSAVASLILTNFFLNTVHANALTRANATGIAKNNSEIKQKLSTMTNTDHREPSSIHKTVL